MLPRENRTWRNCERLCRCLVQSGEKVFVGSSAVVEITVENGTALILYDRQQSVAAAGYVSASQDAEGDFRERVDACSMSLLNTMIRAGSPPEAIEIFALGSYLPSVPSLGAKLRPPACLHPGHNTFLHASAEHGSPCRVVFHVAQGRLIVEAAEHPGGRHNDP